MRVKFLSVLLFFLINVVNIAVCQQLESKLKSADSLYNAKKFTESYQLYSDLFFDDKVYSPQSLLKMAYIKEGLGEFDQALFFLHQYYKSTYDSRVLSKIDEIVSSNNLVGYTQNDFSFVINYIRKNILNITIILSTLILVFMAVVTTKIYKLKQTPFFTSLSTFFVGIVLILLINLSLLPSEAVIVKDKTFVMTAPSSGSDLITVVGKGHKVQVLENGAIWTKVDFNNKIAFVRKDNLQFFPN